MNDEVLRRDMKRKVLIVDDVADIRLMLRYILEKENYQIVGEAANGVEAVEQYRKHRPDITIMDIDMPYKTGVEAAREIRAFAGAARIIFCSGGIPNNGAGFDFGVEGHSVLRKPFLPSQLYKVMTN
jgi:two-component system, chemotaxis family, chemotaxis protein CheY